DFGVERAHLGFAELDEVRAPRRLALVDAPLLRAAQMDRQHIVGVEVPAVGFVPALREENDRVAERAVMRPIERGRERADLGLEDVDALEEARRAVLEVLLQHTAIDELDGPALNQLDAARVLHVDELPAVDDLQELEAEKRVVEVPTQILEPEDRLMLDQTGTVEVAALRRKRLSLLEEEIPHQPQLRRKLGHSHSASKDALKGPAGLLVYNIRLRKITRHAAVHAGTESPDRAARDSRARGVPR